MLNPTCPIHGDSTARADGQVCTCWRITFIISDGTDAPPISTDAWSKAIKDMRDWKATLHGYIGERKPVPQAFQDAFKDSELEP
jgi:hypothetical protein